MRLSRLVDEPGVVTCRGGDVEVGVEVDDLVIVSWFARRGTQSVLRCSSEILRFLSGRVGAVAGRVSFSVFLSPLPLGWVGLRCGLLMLRCALGLSRSPALTVAFLVLASLASSRLRRFGTLFVVVRCPLCRDVGGRPRAASRRSGSRGSGLSGSNTVTGRSLSSIPPALGRFAIDTCSR